MEYASIRLQNDKEVVEVAIKNRPDAVRNVGINMIDREIVLISIKSWPKNFKHISSRFKNDDEIVKIAVEYDGSLLRYASSRLQDNKEIVKIAIQNNSQILKYVSPRLQDDDEIVNIAVKDNPNNYEYASERLQESSGFVNVIITKTITKTIITEYECAVEIPGNIYYSNSFSAEDYFDESEASCINEDIEEDEEFDLYEE